MNKINLETIFVNVKNIQNCTCNFRRIKQYSNIYCNRLIKSILVCKPYLYRMGVWVTPRCPHALVYGAQLFFGMRTVFVFRNRFGGLLDGPFVWLHASCSYIWLCVWTLLIGLCMIPCVLSMFARLSCVHGLILDVQVNPLRMGKCSN